MTKNLLIFLLLIPSVSHAYLPPSFWVIRSITLKNSKFENSTLTHKIKVYDSNGNITKSFQETARLNTKMQGQYLIQSESGQAIAYRTRTVFGLREVERTRPILYDLLFIKEGSSIYDHLKELGLPLKTEKELYDTRLASQEEVSEKPIHKKNNLTKDAEKELKDISAPNTVYMPESGIALVRNENQIAVVLGVPTDETKDILMVDRLKTWDKTMQLWVEKDSLLPIKAVLPPSSTTGSDWIEYRMAQYQVFKNFLYPRTIQVFKNNLLWLKIETLEIQSNTKDISPLKMPPLSETDSETREFLEQYFKFVR